MFGDESFDVAGDLEALGQGYGEGDAFFLGQKGLDVFEAYDDGEGEQCGEYGDEFESGAYGDSECGDKPDHGGGGEAALFAADGEDGSGAEESDSGMVAATVRGKRFIPIADFGFKKWDHWDNWDHWDDWDEFAGGWME